MALCITLNQAGNAQKAKHHDMDNIAVEINASNQLYSKGFETHNAALVVNRYAADGAIMPPNSISISTPQGFLSFFNNGYEHGIRKVSLHTTGLFGRSINMINEEGLYELKDEKEQTIDKGKYLVVWKKTRNGWKMYRDIFNSNLTALHDH